MPLIYVRTKPGRRAYFEGRIIPSDKFIPVTDDPYIRRLVHHWQDVEVEGDAAATGKAAAPSRKEDKPLTGRPTEPRNPPDHGTGAPKPN